jgi:molybdopterin converting factor subunit 1
MVTVKYFASLRTVAGKEEEQFDLGSETTLEKLSDEISKTAPKISEMIRGNNLMVSVNLDVVQSGAIIKDGDAVAFLPPFSGGC